jgi:hypothetical protein
MTLRQTQSLFARKVADLIIQAETMGFEVTLGDAFRDPRLHGPMGTKQGYGAANSFHKQRLAIDLNLFKDGVFLEGTEAHRPLGEWWVSQGGTWGGLFKHADGRPNPDGNHYSWGEV